jgi:hypothetical protein
MQKNTLLYNIMLVFIVTKTAYICPQIPTDHTQRYSSYPFISGDTFRALANHFIDETNHPFNPHDVKQGDIIFVRGYSEFLDQFLKCLPDIKQKFILLTHNMDQSMPGSYAFLLDDNRVIAWFTQNKGAINHPKLFALPIGIANAYWKHGDAAVLSRALKTTRNAPKKNLLYVNFSKHTNIKTRNNVLQYFRNQSFCTFSSPKPWDEYLNDLSCSKFVLSPPGNGLDCHRTWEALLMGSIPVMISTSIDCLFGDLPVIIVQDWNQVTHKFLEKKYKEMKDKTYHFEKLYADYWLDQIRTIQQLARQ